MHLLKNAIDVIPGFFPPQVPGLVKALFGMAMCFAVLANWSAFLVVNDTNKNKPEGSKDTFLLWYPGKALRIFNEYKQRFPAGRKTFWYKVYFMVGSLTFVAWFFLSFWYSQ